MTAYPADADFRRRRTHAVVLRTVVLLVVLLGVVVAVLANRVLRPFDACLLALAAMFLVFHFVRSTGTAPVAQGCGRRRHHTAAEGFASETDALDAGEEGDDAAHARGNAASMYGKLPAHALFSTTAMATTISAEERGETFADMPLGMTLYVSCYADASYAGAGKQWKNVAPHAVPSAPALTFFETPVFTRRDGFVMGSNGLTGPYSSDLGIRAHMAYTLFCVCMFTHASAEDEGDAVVVHLFANTPGLNGLALRSRSVRDRAPDHDHHGDKEGDGGGGGDPFGHTSLVLKTSLHLGGSFRGRGSPVRVSTKRRYMLTVTKDYRNVRLSLTDVEHDGGDAAGGTTELLSGVVPEEDAADGFSNKDALVNERRNWPANLLALGLYDRAIAEREVVALADHFRGIHRMFDPMYVALQREIAKREQMRACPFDATTCKACDEIRDWTDFPALVTAGEPCKAAITAFCSSHPSHSQCTCWSVNHPAYHGACKAYRCSVGSARLQPECGDADNNNSNSKDDDRRRSKGEADRERERRTAEEKEELRRIVRDALMEAHASPGPAPTPAPSPVPSFSSAGPSAASAREVPFPPLEPPAYAAEDDDVAAARGSGGPSSSSSSIWSWLFGGGGRR